MQIAEKTVLNCSPRDTASGHIMRGGDLLWTPVVSSLCTLPAGSALRMPLWSTGTLLRLSPALLQRGLEALSSCHGFLQLLLETLLSNLPFLLLHGQGSVMLQFRFFLSLVTSLTPIFCNNYNNGYLCSMTKM